MEKKKLTKKEEENRTQDSREEIKDDAFRELLLAISEWYGQRQEINMLKVLYRDLLKYNNRLNRATNVMEIMNMLTASGHLHSANLNVLYDTINITEQRGIKDKLPVFQNVEDVKISKFTHYRRKVMKLGMVLIDEDVKKISALYNDPVKEYADTWSLIMDLEHNRVICEGKMEAFIEKLNSLKLQHAVEALTEEIPNASSNSGHSLSEEIPVKLIQKRKGESCDSEGRPYKKYALKLLKELVENKDSLILKDVPEFSDMFENLRIYYKSCGLILTKVGEGSIVFYLSTNDPNALMQLWEIHSSGKLIKDLANILVPVEHQQEFIDEWMTYIDENEYKAVLSKLTGKGFYSQMATSKLNQFLENVDEKVLECTICFNRLKNPKSLTCLHSFCLACLEDWVKVNGELTCPTCSKSYPIPKGGLQKLPPNTFLNNLLETMEQISEKDQMKCVCGKEGKVKYYCQDCKQYLCSTCCDHHTTYRLFANHKMHLIEEVQSMSPTQITLLHPPLCSHHSKPFFCLACLEDWVKIKGKLTCPVCSKSYPIPEGGPQKLQPNTFLNNLLETIKQFSESDKLKCSVCKKEGQVKYYCQDCRQYLCSTCSDQHKKFQVMVNHKLHLMEDVQSMSPSEMTLLHPPQCSHHSKPLEFYCTDCKTPICVNCTIVAPNELEGKHKPISISDAFQTFKETSVALEKSSQHFINKLEDGLKAVIHNATKLKQNKDTCLRDIDNHAEEIFKKVKENRDKMKNEVETIYKRQNKVNDVQMDELKTIISDVNTKRSFLNQLLKSDKSIAMQASERVITSLKEDDNGDYFVTGKCTSQGVCKLDVSANGEPIKQSPMIMKVEKGRLLNTIQIKKASVRDVLTYEDDCLLVSSLTNEILKICNMNGQVIKTIGEGVLSASCGIHVDETSNVLYVAGGWFSCVYMLDMNSGKTIKKIGSKGTNKGQMSDVIDVTLTNQGHLLVLEFGNNRLQLFDNEGRFMKVLVEAGDENGKVRNPCGVVVDEDDNIIVSSKNKLQLFSSDGNFIERIDKPEDGINNPKGLSIISYHPRRLAVANNGDKTALENSIKGWCYPCCTSAEEGSPKCKEKLMAKLGDMEQQG
ncbi:uncharacterized protein LOC117102138 [Anneissia japonica]|uniref:uncharacterized protein LOC117102138 n=1 Tax=Anneissia japonica TaxID=1529436 RepID=UPI001425740C|nr:uncharacterized protein LOC117102138 [Anneissia japonica]